MFVFVAGSFSIYHRITRGKSRCFFQTDSLVARDIVDLMRGQGLDNQRGHSIGLTVSIESQPDNLRIGNVCRGEGSREGALCESSDNLYDDMNLAGYGVRLALISPSDGPPLSEATPSTRS